MKPDLLMVAPIYGPTTAALDAAYVTHKLWQAPDRDALLAQVADRVEAATTTGGTGMDAGFMARLPRLKIIACFGVGVDAVDLAAAKARGIRVTNTPDVLTDDVADLAMGLVLATVRRIVLADRFVRSGQWLKGSMRLNRKLGGKKLGIVGLGRIGLAIARRAEPFGVRVAYHGPRRKEDVPYPYYPDLVVLARECDILVAACPGGDATRGLIGKAVIDALGPDGIFINVARGSVVDEPALVDALASKRLSAAGLDVFANEPRVPEALLTMDNVVLQPHQASATRETRAAMGQLLIDNLAAFFAGRPLPTPVA